MQRYFNNTPYVSTLFSAVDEVCRIVEGGWYNIHLQSTLELIQDNLFKDTLDLNLDCLGFKDSNFYVKTEISSILGIIAVEIDHRWSATEIHQIVTTSEEEIVAVIRTGIDDLQKKFLENRSFFSKGFCNIIETIRMTDKNKATELKENLMSLK
jgi:hypothetical protein